VEKTSQISVPRQSRDVNYLFQFQHRVPERMCLSRFKALNIHVETTIVYTQVYTMSQPNARCPLIVVLLM